MAEIAFEDAHSSSTSQPLGSVSTSANMILTPDPTLAGLASTPNFPHAVEFLESSSVDRPSRLSYDRRSSGGDTAYTGNSAQDIEQLLREPFHDNLLDSILAQDWTELEVESTSYKLGPHDFEREAGHLASQSFESFASQSTNAPLISAMESNRPFTTTTHSFETNGSCFDSPLIQKEPSPMPSSRIPTSRIPNTRKQSQSGHTSVCPVPQAPNFNKTDDGRRSGVRPQCECPRLLSQLVQFTSSPSGSARPATPPLDLLLGLEQLTFSTKKTICECRNCDLGSPYVAIVICTAMDWILESLGRHLRDSAFIDDEKAADVGESGRRRRQDTPHQDWSLEQDISEIGSISALFIGDFPLAEEVSRACIVELLKLRLRRLVGAVKDIVLISRKCKKTLSEVVRCAASDVCCKAESMFGMIEL
ncbi:hypothetical protein BGZ57DRAFT_859775 [Hyaloscypha finlandica]|nr:hypothetical protein BGZ57DRAFT_859775 [Hyaloscypha finlandica]